MPVYTLLLTLLLMPLTGSAAIYKWTDAEGKVHYTQEKPKAPVGKLDKIKVNHHAPIDRSSYKRPGSKSKKAEETPPEQAEPAKKTKKKALSPAQRAKYCASAKRNLATLRAKAQIKQRDKKGNVRFLTEKEKQARIKQARQFVNKNCR